MTELTLPARTYRRVDLATKLLGLGLVAVALELGAASPLGLACALLGVVAATITVFIDPQ